jgi:hypothetical protein
MTISRPRKGELGLLLLGLALGAVVLEVTTRLLGTNAQPKQGYSPVRGRRAYEPKNRAGYRDFEHTRAKAPNTNRVVFVGDSFTYGAGVLFDDTYAKRTERFLAADRGESWESIVLAVPGIDTEQEAVIIENEALAYSPDVLVLGYVLNDAEDPDSAEQRRAAEWANAEAASQTPSFWRHSALLSLIGDRFRAARENRARILNHKALYEDGARGFAGVKRAIARIAELCRQRGIRFVVTLFPLFGNPLDETYPFTSIHTKVAAISQTSGADVVDLLPYYKGLDWRLLVVEGALDEHPNELAHRIAAQALARKLSSVPAGHLSPGGAPR